MAPASGSGGGRTDRRMDGQREGGRKDRPAAAAGTRLWGWDRPGPREPLHLRTLPTDKHGNLALQQKKPQIPMTAAAWLELPDPQTNPPNPTGSAGTLQRGDAGQRRRGSPPPWTCWASLAWAEPLSPQGRRVGTVGLSRKAFGCCCYFGKGRVGGLLFLLYLTCSPFLPPSCPPPLLLLLLLSLFLSLPPLSLSGLLPLVLTAIFAQFTRDKQNF